MPTISIQNHQNVEKLQELEIEVDEGIDIMSQAANGYKKETYAKRRKLGRSRMQRLKEAGIGEDFCNYIEHFASILEPIFSTDR